MDSSEDVLEDLRRVLCKLLEEADALYSGMPKEIKIAGAREVALNKLNKALERLVQLDPAVEATEKARLEQELSQMLEAEMAKYFARS